MKYTTTSEPQKYGISLGLYVYFRSCIIYDIQLHYSSQENWQATAVSSFEYCTKGNASGTSIWDSYVGEKEAVGLVVSKGMWTWRVDIDVSEECTSASNSEDGGNFFIRNFISTFKSIWCYSPQVQHPFFSIQQKCQWPTLWLERKAIRFLPFRFHKKYRIS